MLAFILIFFAQIVFPTPAFPYLVSPTPVPSATAVGTVENQAQGFLENLQTLEANTQNLPTQIAVTNNQIYYEGTPVFPQQGNIVWMWGYVKWIVSGNAAESLLGPFAPLFFILGLFLLASLIFIVINIWRNVVSVIVRAILFIIRYFIPGFG